VAPSTRSPLDQGRAPEADVGYRELARLLAQQFSERPDGPGEALRAGRRWAAVEGQAVLPAPRLSPDETIGAVVDLLSRLGFEPGPGPGAGRIVLHSCPFEEAARESRSVVCGIHLGMLEATVERLGSPLDVVGLEPFVTDDPSACIVHLAARQ
jgi:predicted ArsR family transcriptional regulator